MDPSFADLPSSLIETIMSHLVLKDNIRASAACKSWYEAARTVRVVDKHPWLMCFPKRGNLFELRDPLQWKLYTLDLPELAESTVCYSKDGWLLMRKDTSKEVFFFNPFSRDLISLPKCELAFSQIAFSCPPTSDNCVLLAIKLIPADKLVTVSTCHPGATEWITQDFPTFIKPFYMLSNLVYRRDRFYCFNAEGTLYNFEPSHRTWNYICADKLRCPYIHKMHYVLNEIAVALVEKKGELFVMFTCSNQKPMVYKLFSLEWKEMTRTTLDGLTIFVSFYNSELRINLPWMRNNVYFSRFGYNRKHCVSYSFDESRYNPRKEWDKWVELCPPQSLWIDTPKDFF
ncbi:unnamed protein product [Arabidopsis lyrata]|uniref:F-box protein At4g00893 n=1 Tax=Arabidopsis lyrata subsp. lyrata TaxID=81972 RepID=UPI000A29A7EF|nr:F-box protein At4g00893 [Arabidopsis lyrata subsp. lyrata]XP_020877704.1 F-box protein At4g00893 [Arabidopsis lyrata subsp. lyrata]CAH8273091.1 unnamed protein product [Arabidopsis lyrata]|eukprot:XP_020877703.1 F-box protein At4g00893 [Arabidopsis lyrata subsp. lyrata]